MHRTYSLRNSRAPTASQLQNPPPPPSTTKGRFFGKGGLAYSFRRSAAGAFGPELSRKLSQLVKIEKNVLRSMELTANERRDAAKQLSIWGLENDDDVSDITDKLGVLIYEVSELDDQFIDRYDQYRLTLKSIRDIEGSVQPSRDRKDKITDKITYLKYKDPQSPKIEVLEQELVRAEAESLVAEAQLSNITRSKLRAAFNYQFDSIIEHSEKIALIAGYGKALLELLDDSPVTPGETRPAYDGYEASKQIIIDAESALNEWTLDSAQVKPTLSFKQDYEDFEPEEGEEEEQEDGQGRWSEDEQEDGQIEEPEQEEEGAVEEHEQVGHQQSESLPQQTTA
ncbi:PIL1 [Saccharomyces cerevisiae]|nr:PIL1 [Saccharomyces cerevisiae]